MKKFEEYNDKYRHLARRDSDESPDMQALASAVGAWKFEVKGWSQTKVQHAVYHATDHEAWQQFRCSLKGQSTKMKLLRLALYKEGKEKLYANDAAQLELEHIRVDNYLGALVRGGQLSIDLKVQS